MWASLALLLATMAKAEGLQQPPIQPEAPTPVEGECSRVMPVRVGEPPPATSGGKATCTGDLVPTSQLADLLATEQWAYALRDHGSISKAYYLHQIESLEMELQWTQERLEEARQPDPWWMRPWVQRAIGGATVMGTVVVAAYGLNAVSTL